MLNRTNRVVGFKGLHSRHRAADGEMLFLLPALRDYVLIKCVHCWEPKTQHLCREMRQHTEWLWGTVDVTLGMQRGSRERNFIAISVTQGTPSKDYTTTFEPHRYDLMTPPSLWTQPFILRFEASNTKQAQTLPPSADNQTLQMSTAPVEKILTSVNPLKAPGPNNITGWSPHSTFLNSGNFDHLALPLILIPGRGLNLCHQYCSHCQEGPTVAPCTWETKEGRSRHHPLNQLLQGAPMTAYRNIQPHLLVW